MKKCCAIIIISNARNWSEIHILMQKITGNQETQLWILEERVHIIRD